MKNLIKELIFSKVAGLELGLLQKKKKKIDAFTKKIQRMPILMVVVLQNKKFQEHFFLRNTLAAYDCFEDFFI